MAQKLLSDPDFYQNPDAQNLTINLKSMEQELEQLYDKWSELDSGQRQTSIDCRSGSHTYRYRPTVFVFSRGSH